jgi:hypothetical protein
MKCDQLVSPLFPTAREGPKQNERAARMAVRNGSDHVATSSSAQKRDYQPAPQDATEIGGWIKLPVLQSAYWAVRRDERRAQRERGR